MIVLDLDFGEKEQYRKGKSCEMKMEVCGRGDVDKRR